MTNDDAGYERRILDALDIPLGHAPDGEPCAKCYGIHNPYPGCSYVTLRHWNPDDD